MSSRLSNWKDTDSFEEDRVEDDSLGENRVQEELLGEEEVWEETVGEGVVEEDSLGDDVFEETSVVCIKSVRRADCKDLADEPSLLLGGMGDTSQPLFMDENLPNLGLSSFWLLLEGKS